MTAWRLPVKAVFGDTEYAFHGDFRDVLEIFSYLEDPDLPDYLKWRIAVALFYETRIPNTHFAEAAQYLADFLCGGNRQEEKPAPKLLDWEQDASVIIAEVNKVAGQEIRAIPFVHWWTFLSWFHGIGEGQLSTLVGIREKLRKGKRLEDWEKEFYQTHKHQVDLKVRYSHQELAERQKLKDLLGFDGE